MTHQTINEIIDYSSKNGVEKWVHSFLTSSGSNHHLSLGLKKQQRFWISPKEVSLDRLERCCGPEEHMEYHEPKELWKERIAKLVDKIDSGYELAPFIVEFKKGILSIRDGNHRYEALRRTNHKEYWTIIWCNSEADFVKLQKQI